MQRRKKANAMHSRNVPRQTSPRASCAASSIHLLITDINISSHPSPRFATTSGSKSIRGALSLPLLADGNDSLWSGVGEVPGVLRGDDVVERLGWPEPGGIGKNDEGERFGGMCIGRLYRNLTALLRTPSAGVDRPGKES